MLDDDVHPEDMAAYGDEVTSIAIKYINSTPELYNRVKKYKGVSACVAQECREWAEEHNNELGDLFITELDVVDWTKVSRMV